MFGISFPGSGGAYGTFETLPSFSGLGYSSFLFGSTFTNTPTANLFESSSAGNATINGVPGTTALTTSGATITAAIASGVLTVSTFTSGAALAVGDAIYNSNGVVLGVIASLGTGTGGTGTYNLASGWVTTASATMYTAQARAELPGFSASIYAINNAMSYFAVAKVTGAKGEGLLSDYIANSGPSFGLLVNTSNQALAIARGTSGLVNSAVTLPSNPSTAWALYVATFSATQCQVSHWRTSLGVTSGTTGDMTTVTAPGSTTNKRQVGRPYGAPPASTVAAVGSYTGALTTAQIAQLGATLSGILADAGEVL